MATRQLLRTSQALLRPSPAAGQRIEKWGQPLRVILTDYVEVSKDLFQTAKQRPVKSLFYVLAGAFVAALWKRRPDYTHYVNEVLECSNEIATVSAPLRNPESQAYVDSLMEWMACGRLYCVNFGLFSVCMRREVAPECKNFHATCKYLQPHVWTAGERTVDVGVWGRWVELGRKMVDFDVNEEQLEKSIS